MEYMIGTEEALLSAIDFCDNDLMFLFGSPLSCSYGDILGIPSVKEMLTIIETEVSKRPQTRDAFHTHIEQYESDTEKYQNAFDFLRLYTSPNTVNGIIRKATLKAYKNDMSHIDINDQKALKSLLETPDSWSIPPATQALAEIISSSNKSSNTVLTPNFDPLLSVALNNLGEKSTRIMLHGDSHIEQFHSDNINIVHFHGYWLDSDTLHTNAQLVEERPFFKQSLTRLLNKKTLVVIGYGGWNDAFTQALISLANDNGANFDILWSFYESNQETINSKYSNLLNAMKPALQRGRFKAFGGINCHEFLPKLASIEAERKKESQVRVENISITHGNNVELFTSSEADIMPWVHYYEPAHNHIRRTERSYLIRAFEDRKIINLSAEWGIGHKEFICTLNMTDIYSGAPIYRIDLTDVKNQHDLHERIERGTRCKLQVFIQRLPNKPHIIFFDGLDSSQSGITKNISLIKTIEETISIITEFNQESRILITSRKSLGGSFFPLELSKLEYFDAKEYIINHSSFSATDNTKTIDAIIDISKGIPSRIDSCIRDSAYFSSEELYDEHFTPESYNLNSDADFQNEIVKRVELLASSQDQDQKRAYFLLEALSILEYGDTFSNLKRCNPAFSYNKQHIETLYNLELIEFDKINQDMLSTKNSEDEIKLIRLPTEVRAYVYRKLTLPTVNEISKNIANVHFGNEWRNGIFNFCKLNRQQLSAYNRVFGSSQTLLIQLLKCAIELDASRDIEASFRACEHFCRQLYNTKKYKDVIFFTNQVFAIAKESEKIDSLTTFELLGGKALRMMSNYSEAEELLKKVLSKSERLMRNEKISALVNMMFICEKKDLIDEAIDYANKIIKLDRNNSDAKFTLELYSENNDLLRLKDFELKFRNKKRYVSANNAAIKISFIEENLSDKVRWLNRVINCPGDDQYNKLRAVTRKATLSSNNLDYKPDNKELRLLEDSYILSFSQGITTMFNSAHKILWNYYLVLEKHSYLFNLYRYGSLYWRIYLDIDKEKEYSKKFIQLLQEIPPSEVDLKSYQNAYVIHRANLLIDN